MVRFIRGLPQWENTRPRLTDTRSIIVTSEFIIDTSDPYGDKKKRKKRSGGDHPDAEPSDEEEEGDEGKAQYPHSDDGDDPGEDDDEGGGDKDNSKGKGNGLTKEEKKKLKKKAQEAIELAENMGVDDDTLNQMVDRLKVFDENGDVMDILDAVDAIAVVHDILQNWFDNNKDLFVEIDGGLYRKVIKPKHDWEPGCYVLYDPIHKKINRWEGGYLHTYYIATLRHVRGDNSHEGEQFLDHHDKHFISTHFANTDFENAPFIIKDGFTSSEAELSDWVLGENPNYKHPESDWLVIDLEPHPYPGWDTRTKPISGSGKAPSPNSDDDGKDDIPENHDPAAVVQVTDGGEINVINSQPMTNESWYEKYKGQVSSYADWIYAGILPANFIPPDDPRIKDLVSAEYVYMILECLNGQ